MNNVLTQIQILKCDHADLTKWLLCQNEKSVFIIFPTNRVQSKPPSSHIFICGQLFIPQYNTTQILYFFKGQCTYYIQFPSSATKPFGVVQFNRYKFFTGRGYTTKAVEDRCSQSIHPDCRTDIGQSVTAKLDRQLWPLSRVGLSATASSTFIPRAYRLLPFLACFVGVFFVASILQQAKPRETFTLC